MNTPIGDRLFHGIPRRVAVSRKSAHGRRKIGGREKEKTRMLAINLTVARLEQFRTLQLRIQRERPTDAGLTENKPSFIGNPHVVISCQNPFSANVVTKLVSMATSLRPAISAMSSFDSLSPKTHP